MCVMVFDFQSLEDYIFLVLWIFDNCGLVEIWVLGFEGVFFFDVCIYLCCLKLFFLWVLFGYFGCDVVEKIFYYFDFVEFSYLCWMMCKCNFVCDVCMIW